jgi:hypothetical protein
MTSKRTAASKRAALPRAVDYAKSFLKDWERITRAGRYDMNRLKEVMLLLVAMSRSGQNGLITLWVAVGLDTGNAMLAATFCWPTNLMTAPSMG